MTCSPRYNRFSILQPVHLRRRFRPGFDAGRCEISTSSTNSCSGANPDRQLSVLLAVPLRPLRVLLAAAGRLDDAPIFRVTPWAPPAAGRPSGPCADVRRHSGRGRGFTGRCISLAFATRLLGNVGLFHDIRYRPGGGPAGYAGHFCPPRGRHFWRQGWRRARFFLEILGRLSSSPLSADFFPGLTSPGDVQPSSGSPHVGAHSPSWGIRGLQRRKSRPRTRK